MKPLLFIFTCIVGINASFVGILHGTIISIGGNGTADLPIGWSVTVNPNGTTFIESGAGGVTILFYYQEAADSHKTLQAINYEGVNALLSLDLESIEYNYVRSVVDVGLYPYAFGDPVFQYGPDLNYKFYGGQRTSTITLTNLITTLDIIVYSYVFFDGISIWGARLLVSQDFTNDEIEKANSLINSVTSTTISSPLSDSDGDGISNYDEIIFYQSDPNKKDSNSDGFTDAEITSLGGHPMVDLSDSIEFIQDNANRFELYDSNDLNVARTEGRSSGKQAVISAPGDYNLFSEKSINVARTEGRSSGQQDVISAPGNYNLFSEDSIEDIALGGVMIGRGVDSMLNFTYEIQASGDLQSWSTIETPLFEYSPAVGKEFLRIRIASE